MNNGVSLAEYPIGDLDTGDVYVGDEGGDAEMGQTIEFGDIDETGAPVRKRTTGHKLAARMGAHVAKHSDHRVLAKIQHKRPDVAHRIMQAAAVKQAVKNNGIYYEAIKGGTILSSDLGVDARMAPNEVDALKSSIYLSTPFSPRVFSFTNASPAVLDVVTALNTVIGTSTFYYAGLLIVLAASTLNLNQGATITITRNLADVNGNQLAVNDTIELDSGVRAVEICLLNAQLIAGHPRFWAPLLTAGAVADPTTQVSIAGLPANYTPTARFLVPGDAKVSSLLRML